jgi:hypothetical protein
MSEATELGLTAWHFVTCGDAALMWTQVEAATYPDFHDAYHWCIDQIEPGGPS